MCIVLGVARSTYYESFDKTKSARKIENEELKSTIKILKRDFTTTFINKKMGRRHYIYSYYQRWLVLFSFSS